MRFDEWPPKTGEKVILRQTSQDEVSKKASVLCFVDDTQKHNHKSVNIQNVQNTYG